VEGAFVTLAEEAETHEHSVRVEQARVVFVLVVGAGMRRGEVLGLRWRNVHLADPDGASLRVSETWVRDAIDTPKSESSERTIALGQKLAGELFDHRGRTAFGGEDERVFCHREMGGALDHNRSAKTLRVALGKAEITAYVRPFHDGRNTSITNGAKAGMNPMGADAAGGALGLQDDADLHRPRR
jgi:integrase